MSDSEASSRAAPDDGAVEKALRDAVRAVYKSQQLENLTVKRVRKTAEEALDLSDDYLKADAKWKDRSKQIIEDEVAAHDRDGQDDEEDDLKPAKAKPRAQPAKPKAAAPKRKSSDMATKKKPAAAKAGSRKRRKVSASSEEEDAASESEEAISDEKSPPPPAKALVKRNARQPRKAQVVEDSEESADEAAAQVEEAPEKGKASEPVDSDNDNDQKQDDKNNAQAHASESELSELIDEEPKPKKTAKKSAPPKKKVEDSESELSELIDEDPAPKKKATKKAAPTKSKTAKGRTAAPKPDKSENPDDAEIKRLQGWLIKCGIRKLWGKELKPYETPKAKINHLKGMLKDAGMDGRYSVEKARQIKEQRELAADLEAVQEGAKMWGQDDEEEEGRPKRRLAKGLKDLEGLVDADGGEETD